MKNNKNVPNNIGQRMVNSVVLQTLTPLSLHHIISISAKSCMWWREWRSFQHVYNALIAFIMLQSIMLFVQRTFQKEERSSQWFFAVAGKYVYNIQIHMSNFQPVRLPPSHIYISNEIGGFKRDSWNIIIYNHSLLHRRNSIKIKTTRLLANRIRHFSSMHIQSSKSNAKRWR